MRSEVTRRIVHSTATVVPLSYVFVGPMDWNDVQMLMAGGLILAVVLEFFRLVVGLDWRIYERLTRDYEQRNLAGYFLAVVGMAVVAFAFPPPHTAGQVLSVPNVAVAAMLMLTIADPISGLLSDEELRDVKRTYVLFVTFGVSVLLAIPFVPPLAALFGAIATTVADGYKPIVRGYVIDDNLTIPIVSGAVMVLTIRYLSVGVV